ncbi:MAG: glycosyl transferase family 2 [Ilumatobacteraceae bacterium]|nr:glycosyl transferase family 2 [Ilumatobacteraceae bacterium]
MRLPRITAVVVVHGSPAETVRACVQSLLDATDVDLHVVLVDNASPDGGAACEPWATVERVTLVRSPDNRGFAAGVNQGLRRVRGGDLILLLNDDATVAADAPRVCARMLAAHPDAVAVAPRVMLANEPELIDSIGVVIRPNGEAFNAYIGQPWRAQVSDGDVVFGPCFGAALFRADGFDSAVGPIDERYRLYYEDIDWGLRARRAGLVTVAATDAVVFHQHALSTRLLGEATRYELVQRNLLLCVAKNFSWRPATRAWASRLVVHTKGVIKGPFRIERLRSMARAVIGLPSVLRARRSLPLPEPSFDESAMFAYATGMSPNFSAETYRSREKLE